MISNLENPWMKKIKKDEEFKAQKISLEKLVKSARALLNDDKYLEYRKIYQSYHDREIENIMQLAEQDPIKYAFKVRQVVDTLKAYRLLISSIEDNASIQLEEDDK
jgi:hypothetical protein